MSEQRTRYPGAQPFETEQQGIFFGRQKDIEALGRLVRQEPLTVLYSKSGMGKSSLLNAGVIPNIQAEGEYGPLRIRFNAFDKDASLDGQAMPVMRATRTIRSGKSKSPTFLDRLIENEATLWHDIKEQQLLAYEAQASGKAVPTKLMLVFDQFEELFTYPPEAVLAFRKQLAEALYTPLPRRYWDMLDLYGKEQSPLSNAEQTLLETPLDLRVVVAIRQDRMHLLGNLNDYLPTISKTWFELQPLNEEQAKEAITLPAALSGNYASDPFHYNEQALADILHFLTKGEKEKIESTQLQIVCNSLEKKAMAQKLSLIHASDVGDLDAVIENYYLEKIASIGDEEEQLAARRLVEEGLVYEEEERRLSLYEGIILKVYDIEPDTLRKLVDSHLLRAEPSLQGGYTYELSHDTLVAPVLKAKAKRKAGELLEAEQEALRIKELELADLRRKAEEERQKAEQERQLREQAEQAKAEADKLKIEAESQRSLAQQKEKQSRQRTRVAVFVSIFALALAGLAFWFYQQSAANAVKALNAQVEAKRNENMALLSADTARIARQQAVDNLNLAVKREKEAKANLERAEKGETDAKQNYEAAQKARKEAEDNLTKATKANASTVELLLANADREVYNLRYEDALEKLKAAASLGALKPEVAAALLEIAFWHGEAGNTQRASALLDSAATLMNKNISIRQPFRETIKAFDSNIYKKLMQRYYPIMMLVSGGTFEMGCDPKIDPDCDSDEVLHKQKVSSFQMAKTETTWWQYYLFCKAAGHEYESPSWGTDGDNPAVYVSFFDAALYLNWVSKQFELDTFYIIENKRKGDYGDYYDVSLNLNASKGFRLPTEAEWEFAAKGGNHPDNTIYSGDNDLDSVGWYGGNSGSRTRPVGKKKGNALGLYDISGNVWERCWDWKTAYEEKPPLDYKGPEMATRYRVLRGGSWSGYDGYACRVALRGIGFPDDRSGDGGGDLGFRCAREF